MKLLYALSSYAILALGVLHMATTFRLSSSPAGKVWFFGAGMALALAGVLNLLNRRYGLAASGLRIACIVTNVFMLGFAIVAGRVTGAGAAGWAMMLTVFIASLVLSAIPSASLK